MIRPRHQKYRLFIDKNYVSITKYDIAEWNDITMELREFIRTYIENGKPMVVADAPEIKQNTEKAKEAHFEALDDKNVKVILQGACSGCPSSTFTLKNGIENMLKEMLNGKVETVEAING